MYFTDMNKMPPFFLLLFLLAGLAGAQDRSLLRVLQADRLDGRLVGDIEYRELVGNVRMQQDNVRISCDRAMQNLTNNTVQLSGNVVILQDTLELRTPRGDYDANTRVASSTAGVWLHDGHVTLSAAVGRYETGSRVADFVSDVLIDDTSATIRAGMMRYVRDSALIVAWRRVRIRFKDEEALIIADSVRHYPDEKRSHFYHDPVLWQIDTAYQRRDADGVIDSLDLDTLNIAARYMEAHRDSSNRFLCEGEVRIVRSDFTARCGMAHFLRSDSLIILREEPILWYGDNQLSGDSITARLEDDELRDLFVSGAAFSASRSKPSEQDTLYPPGRYDQTRGRDMHLRFLDSKADYIRVDGAATSLYYLYDEGALNGVRLESGDVIIVSFEEGDAKTIRTLGGVEGTYYPEKYVNGKESGYNLEGFLWRDDRPALLPWPEATAPDTNGKAPAPPAQ